MKRKVALLQVLAPHAPLLIMDEPTNALDPTMRDELLEQVRAGPRPRPGGAVLVARPERGRSRSATASAILQRGRLVHLQDMAELREGRLVERRLDGAWRPDRRLPRPAACASRQNDG